MADAILASSGIYQIRNTINGKVYVGSSVCFSDRWAEHRRQLSQSRHHSCKLQRAWLKYGADALQFEVIEVVADKARLIEREQYYLDKLRAVSSGYNIMPTAGSRLGHRASDELKARLSATHKAKALADGYSNNFEGKTHSLDTKAKMSAAAKVRGNEHLAAMHERNRGSKASEETRAKMSAAAKANGISDETRAKMIASRIRNGKKQSAETRKKISMSKIGKVISAETIAKRVVALTGKRHSAETKAKISASHRARHATTVASMVAE